MIVDTLEQTLNGGYKGLFGEIVTEDCYHLRSIDWQPDIVFDLGANIGVFTRFARTLFPGAQIISVEPDPENCAHFRKFTKDPNVMLIEAAIGKEEVWHYLTSANGAMECYLSTGLGYPSGAMQKVFTESRGTIEPVNCVVILPAILINDYKWPDMRSIIKIDIEGAENSIFEDEASVQCIQQIDFIAMELHYYAINGIEQKKVVERTNQFIETIKTTHNVELNHPYLIARKKTGSDADKLS